MSREDLVLELWGENGVKRLFYPVFVFKAVFLKNHSNVLTDIVHTGIRDNFDHLAKTACRKKFWFLSYGGKSGVKWHFYPVFGL